jgi:hypothetical protein
MSQAQDQSGSLRIATPCQASWEGMAGDERVRHCTLCSLNVYNFAEMTRAEVRDLLVRTEGRVCARLYRRADGTVLTRDCPTGLRAMRQRASRVAAASVAALCTLPAFALGSRSGEKPPLKIHGSKVKLEIERVATRQPAVFAGVVDFGGPLPGVTITLRNEASKRELTTITDAKGAFRITSLDDGLYRVEVTLAGLASATMEHLRLKASEVTHANIALRIEDKVTVTMGEVVTVPVTMNRASNTFSEQIIKKLPF